MTEEKGLVMEKKYKFIFHLTIVKHVLVKYITWIFVQINREMVMYEFREQGC